MRSTCRFLFFSLRFPCRLRRNCGKLLLGIPFTLPSDLGFRTGLGSRFSAISFDLRSFVMVIQGLLVILINLKRLGCLRFTGLRVK